MFSKKKYYAITIEMQFVLLIEIVDSNGLNSLHEVFTSRNPISVYRLFLWFATDNKMQAMKNVRVNCYCNHHQTKMMINLHKTLVNNKFYGCRATIDKIKCTFL